MKLAAGMKLVLASHNPGKLREIRGLVEPLGVEAVSAAALGLAEPEETGTTFIANARLSLLSQDESWSVSAWVKNLNDEEYRTAAQDLALSLGFSEIVVGTPTTWGLEFEYRF